MFKQIRPAVLALSVAAAFAAPIGQNQLNTYQMFAEMANKKQLAGAGNTIEFVGFDGKGSPQESLT